MIDYEYRVVPAPNRGKRARGVKGPDGRFANTLETLMNSLAAEGWEYLRADTLPSEERAGLTSFETHYRSVLIFRRPARASETASKETEKPHNTNALPTPPAKEERLSLPAPSMDFDMEETVGTSNVLPIALIERARHVSKDSDRKDKDVAAE